MIGMICHPLWCNKNSKIDNKQYFFYKSGYEKGFTHVIDLLDKNSICISIDYL